MTRYKIIEQGWTTGVGHDPWTILCLWRTCLHVTIEKPYTRWCMRRNLTWVFLSMSNYSLYGRTAGVSFIWPQNLLCFLVLLIQLRLIWLESNRTGLKNSVVYVRSAKFDDKHFPFQERRATEKGWTEMPEGVMWGKRVFAGWRKRFFLQPNSNWPIAHVSSIRSMLAFAAQYSMKPRQIAILTAYLNAGIQEEKSMKQAEGIIQVDEMTCSVSLKPAYMVWNSRVGTGTCPWDKLRWKLGLTHAYMSCLSVV